MRENSARFNYVPSLEASKRSEGVRGGLTSAKNQKTNWCWLETAGCICAVFQFDGDKVSNAEAHN